VSLDAHAETVNRVISALREERRRQGISEETLARLAGISRGGVRHVEEGQFRPTLHTLLKIAETLNLNFLDVLAKAQPSASKKRRNP
jgi:transcriptional regulator with XRE-family HTH domain